MSTERTPFVTDERVEQIIKALYPINGLTKGPDTRMQLVRRVAAERMAYELRNQYEAELARKDAEIEAMRNPWISVKDRVPEPGLPVIAFVTDPKNPQWSRRIRAAYAEEGTLELGEGEPWDGCTCDEENGDWFCQPGWYEHNWYEDTNWRVTDTVTHWMPLPTPPQP